MISLVCVRAGRLHLLRYVCVAPFIYFGTMVALSPRGIWAIAGEPRDCCCCRHISCEHRRLGSSLSLHTPLFPIGRVSALPSYWLVVFFCRSDMSISKSYPVKGDVLKCFDQAKLRRFLHLRFISDTTEHFYWFVARSQFCSTI